MYCKVYDARLEQTFSSLGLINLLEISFRLEKPRRLKDLSYSVGRKSLLLLRGPSFPLKGHFAAASRAREEKLTLCRGEETIFGRSEQRKRRKVAKGAIQKERARGGKKGCAVDSVGCWLTEIRATNVSFSFAALLSFVAPSSVGRQSKGSQRSNNVFLTYKTCSSTFCVTIDNQNPTCTKVSTFTEEDSVTKRHAIDGDISDFRKGKK